MNKDYLSEFTKEWKEKLREFDENLSFAREISRAAIFKLIILSASIVGFSTSIFSIPILQSKLNLEMLRYSWYCFVALIIIGFFILMFEGRVKYGKTWKHSQVSQYPEKYDYSWREKTYAFLITVLTLFYPANLLFNKIYTDEQEKKFKNRVNGLVIQKLAKLEHDLIFLENIIFILFVCGLVLLILSFT